MFSIVNTSARQFILLVIFLSFICTITAQSQSIYPLKIEDKKAVYFQPDQFSIAADGIHDDSDALQKAIDQVAENGQFGIVFIPEGKYKLNKTIYVWKGIRIIGYGKNRPVFFRDGNDADNRVGDSEYMIYFANNRRRNGEISDANAGTFYSAISNIDFEVQNGNSKMVCIRSNYAQHCFISSCNFELGTSLAAIDHVGNEISNCRFLNGETAIQAFRTSPGWPIVLIDSYFEGQTKAAIETQDAGLTIIRTQFKNAPSVIVTRPDKPEKLFMEDCRFENIANAAVVIDDEYNAYSQYNIRNLTCINVPLFARLRKSATEIKGKGKVYQVANFMHGLQMKDSGDIDSIETNCEINQLAKIPELPVSDIATLPAQAKWINMADLGAIGNSDFDNTAIIQQAINLHDVLYFPIGRYRITDQLILRPNTVLIGLNPIATQILISDNTKSFAGTGNPKALIESSVGGNNIISGIGIDAGGINPRAAGIKWMAGEHSLISDVKFMGGHGTFDTTGTYLKIYNNNGTADNDITRKWDSQYWSLWVANGGGGTFKNIWTASPFAQAGFYVSNTTTPGRVYGMSLEHHVRNEAQFKNVSNWNLYAFQMEEEQGEGWNALPLEIDHCTRLRFANLYFYRTSRTQSPYPYATLVKKSANIEFCNVHSYSSTRFVFDNTVFVEDDQLGIRSLEISNLKISGNPPKTDGRKNLIQATKLTGGFEFADALTADQEGNVYFADSRWNEIYRYSPEKKEVTLICDLPVSPAGLAVDQSGRLLVKTVKNAVISLDIHQTPIEEFELLAKDSVIGSGVKWGIYPAYVHSSFDGFCDKLGKNRLEFYHNSDHTTTVVNTMEPREPHNLGIAKPGQKFYLIQDEMHKTYAFDVMTNGELRNPVLFAERGDCQAITDKKGNVYIAAENILVYDQKGNLIKTIDVPERPSSITFGGKAGKTLFITARSSLYGVDIE
jgi:sugar lactone lactonase YvrE